MDPNFFGWLEKESKSIMQIDIKYLRWKLYWVRSEMESSSSLQIGNFNSIAVARPTTDLIFQPINAMRWNKWKFNPFIPINVSWVFGTCCCSCSFALSRQKVFVCQWNKNLHLHIHHKYLSYSHDIPCSRQTAVEQAASNFISNAHCRLSKNRALTSVNVLLPWIQKKTVFSLLGTAHKVLKGMNFSCK